MSQEKVKHEQFAVRFNTACKNSDVIPPIRHGKLQKIVSLFETYFDEKITIETPRKWQEGLSIPRGKRMVQLAQILNVSPEWLEHGVRTSSATGGLRSEENSSDPCALIMAGLARANQGHAAIPFGKIGTNIELRMGMDDVEGYATRASIHKNVLVFYIPRQAEDKIIFPVVIEDNSLRFFAVPPGISTGVFSRLSQQMKVKIPLKDIYELEDLNEPLPFSE